jgi:putative Holliday junction resolvase
MLLGIDYGRSKIGLAFGHGSLAAPLKVIHFKNPSQMFEKLLREINADDYKLIVVGVSEADMALEIRNFILELKKHTEIPIEEFDETLSSRDAQELSRQAGIARTKRKQMEDAYAAALMLQNYLDTRL